MVSWEKIADILTDAVLRGIAMEVRDIPYEGMTRDFVQEQVDVFNNKNRNTGCVFFRSQIETNKIVVIFAGWSEHFAMLSVARGLTCNILYFQEHSDFWYTGSNILPRIEHIGNFIVHNFSGMDFLFFGQSSGAYAALAASKNVKSAITIAISPQTFADSFIKKQIKFSQLLNVVSAPDALLDLSIYLRDGACSERYLLVSASESENPFEQHMWLDHIHAVRMIDIQKLSVFMVRANRHSLVLRNSELISLLLNAITNDPTDAERHVSSAVDLLSARSLERVL